MIEWENKIISYVNGELSQVEKEELMQQISDSPELQKLLEVYQSIESDVDNTIEELPSNRLRHNFDQHLQEIQKEENTNQTVKVLSLKSIVKYAAVGVIFLAAGVTIWNQLDTNETSSEQVAINAILSDMESKSDTEKIKALYVNNQPTNDNQSKIKQVLIESLKNDKSSNVRLASVETLMEYVDDDLVRSALIRSLGVEEDPQVQVAIIMALSASKNEEIIKPLEEIINKEGGYKFVKDEAHVGIMNVTSM